MRRTYGSGSSLIRVQAGHALASVVWSRSSASDQSWVSKYAVRSRCAERVATNSSKDGLSPIGVPSWRPDRDPHSSHPLRDQRCQTLPHGGYSTVTDFARLRGLSTLLPRATASSHAKT